MLLPRINENKMSNKTFIQSLSQSPCVLNLIEQFLDPKADINLKLKRRNENETKQ